MKTTNTNNSLSLNEAIIDLYLNVKIRKQDEIENYGKDEEEKERDKLRKTSPFTLIEYIKSSVEILIDLKVQEKIQDKMIKRENNLNQEFNDEEVNEYEKLLRKLEADIRSYIKIEHQMKLYAESLQSKIEDLEKNIGDLKAKNSQFNSVSSQNNKIKPSPSKPNLETFENEINNYKNEINHLNQLVKKYEEHNLKIPELEKKIKTQKLKHEKEIKDMENYYKDKMKKYEDKLRNYNSYTNTTANTINNNHNHVSNNTMNTLHSNLNGHNNYHDLESNNKNKPKTFSDIPNEYATHRVFGNNKLSLNNNVNRQTQKHSSNSKTIDDGEIDRVNYEHSHGKNNKSSNKVKSRTQSPDIKLMNGNLNKTNYNTTHDNSNRKDLETINSKLEDFKKKAEKTLNQNLSNIIKDLRSATKDRENKSRSRDKINESEIERRLKNCKTINDSNQQTLDSTTRNFKNDFGEVYITNAKTHRKYESYHNLGSLIPKKKESANDSKSSLYVNNTSNNNNNEINCYANKNSKAPINSSLMPKNNSSKKLNNRENSRDYKDVSGNNTPNKNLAAKNIQNNSNIILNQQGVPCYNNINIYTSGLSGLKTGNDCNLRNYIFNKVGHHKKSASSIKLSSGPNKSSNHSRSNSTIGK